MTERVGSRAIDTLNADDDAAVRGLNGWIALFWLTLFVACVTAPIDLGVSPRLVVMAVLVPVLAGAYHSLGVRAIRRETPRSLAAFLAVGVPAMCGLVLVHPVFHVLLFALYPVCFAASDSLRTGLIAAAVLSVGVTVADVSTHGWSSEAWAIAGLQTVIGLMFAVVLGTYITRIVEQSRRRADLIAELERTRGELAAANRQAGMMAERQRLANEIHDTLAQGFTSVLMLVQAAESALTRDEASVRRHLASAERTARENLAEARSLVAALQPAPLQDATLADAVRRISQAFADEQGIAVAVQVQGEPRLLAAAEEVVVVRATQEALANVRKHAAARRVDIVLTYTADAVALTVHDDGAGFDLDTLSGTEGFGIRGIRARLVEVGGALTVHSATGEGTTVEVRL